MLGRCLSVLGLGGRRLRRLPGEGVDTRPRGPGEVDVIKSIEKGGSGSRRHGECFVGGMGAWLGE
jgi:hypothetical protein